MRAREQRRKVRFNARMRHDQTWSDVVIRDLSSRGMLLSTATPPPPGAYLEICGPATSIVVRTVWVDDQRFGVRSQDRIDVEAALSSGRLRAEDPPLAAMRLPLPPAHTGHAENRWRGSAIEFMAAITVIMVAAVTAAILLNTVLGTPLRIVVASLGGE
jgi:hypothetical protein